MLRLVLSVLSTQKEIQDIKKTKNTLILISNIHLLELEITKLLLYIFENYCSNSNTEPRLDDYLDLTGRELHNPQSIRRAVKSLRKVKIQYYNNNFKITEEFLFKHIQLTKGIIKYEINTFFRSKLSSKGYGHVDIFIPDYVFKEKSFRCHYKNRVRLAILVFLCTNNINPNWLKEKNNRNRITDKIIDILSTQGLKTTRSFAEECVQEYISNTVL